MRRVRSRHSGDSVSADVIVTVDAELSTAESHGVATAVENALARELGILDVTVHVEPSG